METLYLGLVSVKVRVIYKVNSVILKIETKSHRFNMNILVVRFFQNTSIFQFLKHLFKDISICCLHTMTNDNLCS